MGLNIPPWSKLIFKDHKENKTVKQIGIFLFDSRTRGPVLTADQHRGTNHSHSQGALD